MIDDDKDVCAIIGSGLQHHDFVVTIYNDPREALLQFKPNHYNIILLDVRMPGLSGFQLAKRIWSTEPDIKIFFFSAFEIYEREAKLLFRDLRNIQFIKKPIVVKELVEHITKSLQVNK